MDTSRSSHGHLLRDIALDISSLHDPDLILTGLVRRVRVAVGCELAYVSLNDHESRSTEIRYSEGIRTSNYRAIRMPIGTGVLGMAAAGVTTESPDYLRDVAKLHIEDVDEAVQGEGVRAILSTPLRAGGEVLGALTVANRSSGAFHPGQRAILEDAALIGSIAVEVSSLRRDVARQDREFAAQLEQLAADGADDSMRLRVADELSSALASGRGTTDLLRIASDLVGGSVVIGDEESPSVAAHTIAVPLEAGGVIEITGDDGRWAAALGATIATYISTALLYERAIEDARHLRESEQVEHLIAPSRDDSTRPPRTGLAGAGPAAVTVIEIADPNRRRSALASVRRGLASEALATERRGSLIVVSRGASARSVLADTVAHSHGYGGHAICSHDAAIPNAFLEASLVARSMRTLRRPQELAEVADLGVVAFAIGNLNESVDAYVSSFLGPLLDDSTRGQRLLETALSYLDCHASVAEVATTLRIHENTVRQRLDRLDEVLPGWRSGPHSLDFHVALRTRSLLKPSMASS